MVHPKVQAPPLVRPHPVLQQGRSRLNYYQGRGGQRVTAAERDGSARLPDHRRHRRCICRNVNDADQVISDSPASASVLVIMRIAPVGTRSPKPTVV